MESDQKLRALCSEVAIVLREERLKRSLSMTRLAERAGLSQQMVSYIERGLRNPTLEVLLRIAHVLDIRLDKVLARAYSAVGRTVDHKRRCSQARK